MSACERGIQSQQAVEIFDLMPGAPLQRSTVTFNDAICACEKGWQTPQALGIPEQMLVNRTLGEGVQRDTITHKAAMLLCT